MLLVGFSYLSGYAIDQVEEVIYSQVFECFYRGVEFCQILFVSIEMIIWLLFLILWMSVHYTDTTCVPGVAGTPQGGSLPLDLFSQAGPQVS